MTILLSTSSLAGTARTLVAVGTPRLAVMLVTVRAAAPRSLLTSVPSGGLGGESRAWLGGAGRVEPGGEDEAWLGGAGAAAGEACGAGAAWGGGGARGGGGGRGGWRGCGGRGG